jgi:serine protease
VRLVSLVMVVVLCFQIEATALASVSETSARQVQDLPATEHLIVARVLPWDSSDSTYSLIQVPLNGRALAFALHQEKMVEGTIAVAMEQTLRESLVPGDSLFSEQEHLRSPTSESYGVDAVRAWDTTRGSEEIVVAVVDSGVRPHADLAARLLPGYDFVDGDGDASDPGCTTNLSSWHGTHVAGIVAAGINGFGVVGVAPEIRVLPVRVSSCGGGGQTAILNGVRWAAGLAVPGYPVNPNPADVINISMGALAACDSVSQAVFDEVTSVGALVIAAAGNERLPASNSYPANCRNVMSVGSSLDNGDRASYSNYGSDVDVYAPGGPLTSGILSTIDIGADRPRGDGYARYPGTSMATPVVSGTAALILSVDRSLLPGQVAQVIRDSAIRCRSGTCPQNIVDAQRAVALARSDVPSDAPVDPDVGSPTVTPPPESNQNIFQDRFSGEDKFLVAESVARYFQQRGKGIAGDLHVTLANGDSYPDGLAASVIAGHHDGVILFTNKDDLPFATDRFLTEFYVRNVTIIGGPAVVSKTLETRLQSRGISIDRLWGANRYETANAVANASIDYGNSLLYENKPFLFIASGGNFPDAVAAGSALYAGSYPLVLSSKNGLGQSSLDLIALWNRANPTGQVIILGGTAAVPARVTTQMAEYKRPWGTGPSGKLDGFYGGIYCDPYPMSWSQCPIDEIPEPITKVRRLSGPDRFATAAAIASWAKRYVFSNTTGDVGFASGLAFTDALAAAPLLGQSPFQGPMLLVSTCSNLPMTTRDAARGFEAQRIIGSKKSLCDYDAKLLKGLS